MNDEKQPTEKTRISAYIDQVTLDEIDRLVENKVYRSTSHAVDVALSDLVKKHKEQPEN